MHYYRGYKVEMVLIQYYYQRRDAFVVAAVKVSPFQQWTTVYPAQSRLEFYFRVSRLFKGEPEHSFNSIRPHAANQTKLGDALGHITLGAPSVSFGERRPMP